MGKKILPNYIRLFLKFSDLNLKECKRWPVICVAQMKNKLYWLDPDKVNRQTHIDQVKAGEIL